MLKDERDFILQHSSFIFVLCSAERVRFELTVTHTSYNGFRDRPIQPLWHLSKLTRIFYFGLLARDASFMRLPKAIARSDSTRGSASHL